jgi:hypothetical protein
MHFSELFFHLLHCDGNEEQYFEAFTSQQLERENGGRFHLAVRTFGEN